MSGHLNTLGTNNHQKSSNHTSHTELLNVINHIPYVVYYIPETTLTLLCLLVPCFAQALTQLPFATTLFSVPMNLLLVCCLFICFLDSTYKWDHKVPAFNLFHLAWSFRFIHAAANGKIFLLMVEYVCLYIGSSSPVYPLMDISVVSISWLL